MDRFRTGPAVQANGAAEATWLAGPALAAVGRWLCGVLIVLFWCTTGLVAWRRLVGALNEPLTPWGLFAAGAAVASVCLAVRLLWLRFPPGLGSSRLDYLVAAACSAAVLAFGAALSLPGTTRTGLLVLWGLLAAEECWAWRPAVWRTARGAPVELPAREQPEASPPRAGPRPPVLQTPADDVLQQLSRSRAADGSEQLCGWLRAPFAPGQRTANVHLAFCPPFARTPQLAVEQLEGPAARIKTGQLLAHGARIELKLDAASDTDQSVLLQFTAQSEAGQ